MRPRFYLSFGPGPGADMTVYERLNTWGWPRKRVVAVFYDLKAAEDLIGELNAADGASEILESVRTGKWRPKS